jgi:hypothetical protein
MQQEQRHHHATRRMFAELSKIPRISVLKKTRIHGVRFLLDQTRQLFAFTARHATRFILAPLRQHRLFFILSIPLKDGIR